MKIVMPGIELECTVEECYQLITSSKTLEKVLYALTNLQPIPEVQTPLEVKTDALTPPPAPNQWEGVELSHNFPKAWEATTYALMKSFVAFNIPDVTGPHSECNPTHYMAYHRWIKALEGVEVVKEGTRLVVTPYYFENGVKVLAPRRTPKQPQRVRGSAWRRRRSPEPAIDVLEA